MRRHHHCSPVLDCSISEESAVARLLLGSPAPAANKRRVSRMRPSRAPVSVMWSIFIAMALSIRAAAACIECARAAGCTHCDQGFDRPASNTSADFERPDRTYLVAVKILDLARFFDCLDAPGHPSDQIIYAVDRQGLYIEVDMSDVLDNARRSTKDCDHVVTNETTVLDYLTFFHGPSLGGRSVSFAAEDETIVGSNIAADQSDLDPHTVMPAQPISPNFWAATHGAHFCGE